MDVCNVKNTFALTSQYPSTACVIDITVLGDTAVLEKKKKRKL
jgi:hypothetical protein